jgi:3-oxoacyl-[acyl-carrier-protein] synthase III
MSQWHYGTFTPLNFHMNKQESVYILGAGSSLGTKVDHNDSLENYFGRKKNSILHLTGIQTRFHFEQGETIVQSGIKSAQVALDDASIDISQINGIYSACDACCPMHIPTFSTLVGVALGGENFKSVSLQGGCAAPLQALELAFNQLQVDSSHGRVRYYLIVCGDHPSLSVNPNDWASRILFSDATSALVVSNAPQVQGLRIKEISSSIIATKKLESISFKNARYTEKAGRDDVTYFYMNGGTVFRYAHDVFTQIKKILSHSNEDSRDYYIIPHQSNLRILRLGLRILDIPEEQMYTEGIQLKGNTSLASIFIGLEFLRKHPEIKPPQRKVLLLGYGAEWQLAYALLEQCSIR